MLQIDERAALAEWATVLESGKYRQASGQLVARYSEGDHEDKMYDAHCCLGVAGRCVGIPRTTMLDLGLLAELVGKRKKHRSPLLRFLTLYKTQTSDNCEELHYSHIVSEAEEIFAYFNDTLEMSFEEIAFQIYLFLELDKTDDLELFFKPITEEEEAHA